MVFIIDHIHHLMNISKMLIFTYDSDRRVYIARHIAYCVYLKKLLTIYQPIINISLVRMFVSHCLHSYGFYYRSHTSFN